VQHYSRTTPKGHESIEAFEVMAMDFESSLTQVFSSSAYEKSSGSSTGMISGSSGNVLSAPLSALPDGPEIIPVEDPEPPVLMNTQ